MSAMAPTSSIKPAAFDALAALGRWCEILIQPHHRRHYAVRLTLSDGRAMRSSGRECDRGPVRLILTATPGPAPLALAGAPPAGSSLLAPLLLYLWAHCVSMRLPPAGIFISTERRAFS